MYDATIKLKTRSEIAVSTIAAHFDKPAGFAFEAGQYVEMALPHPPDTVPDDVQHTFSIASAPYENELIFTTRIQESVFKNVLRTMPLGTAVGIKGPFGSLTLSGEREHTVVILTGGIGITPFRSMVLQATKNEAAKRVFLFFYTNRRPEDAVFLGVDPRRPGSAGGWNSGLRACRRSRCGANRDRF